MDLCPGGGSPVTNSGGHYEVCDLDSPCSGKAVCNPTYGVCCDSESFQLFVRQHWVFILSFAWEEEELRAGAEEHGLPVRLGRASYVRRISSAGEEQRAPCVNVLSFTAEDDC